MKNKLSLNILSASIVAATFYLPTAQADMAILETDITPGNTYVSAGYGKVIMSQDLDGVISKVDITDVTVSTLDLYSSGKALGNVIPLVSMGTTIGEIENEGKNSEFNIKAGLALETGNKRHIIYAGYDIAGEDYRDRIELGAILRATDIENTNVGIEFELKANFNEGTDDVSGGHTYSISSNAKAMLNSRLFIQADLSLGLQTDTEYDNSYIENGPEISSEVTLGFQARENLQIAGSVFASSQNHKYYDSNSVNYLTNQRIFSGASLTLTLAI